MTRERWDRLDRFLATVGPAQPPTGGRLGAVLALLAGTADDDFEIVYTRRRDDLANHPGQISFPGGRREAGESVEAAAVREAREEIGLDPRSVTVLGRLPAFYVAPSRFWLQTVVARWDRPHDLLPEQAEVAEILRVPLRTLLDRDAWRVVGLSVSGWTWAWQLGAGSTEPSGPARAGAVGAPPETAPTRMDNPRLLLWGATARVTAALLDALEPGWNRGLAPADLIAEREVRPWRTRLDRGATRPPRLPGVPERDLAAVAVDGPQTPPTDAESARVGRSVADAAARLLTGRRRVLVLAGTGGNGAAGVRAAQVLRRDGVDVTIVSGGPADRLRRGSREGEAALPHGARAFDGDLPEADLVIDALVGGGLDGPLRGQPLAILHALRHRVAPVLSVDVPTGMHPQKGIVGELVTADVTVAIGGLRAGALQPGLAPFLGDLYLATDGGHVPLLRLVARGAAGGWRE